MQGLKKTGVTHTNDKLQKTVEKLCILREGPIHKTVEKLCILREGLIHTNSGHFSQLILNAGELDLGFHGTTFLHCGSTFVCIE